MPTSRSDPWLSQNDMERENMPYSTYNIVVTRDEATYVFNVENKTIFSILKITSSGLLLQKRWILTVDKTRELSDFIWPSDKCDRYNNCGNSGICSINKCECLPEDEDAWGMEDWKRGCVRKTQLHCEGDKFQKLGKMKLPDSTLTLVDKNHGLKECKNKCFENCNCTAYANTDMKSGGSGCVIWTGELLDLRINNIAGQDLFVRVAAIDIVTVAEGKKMSRKTKALIAAAAAIVSGLLLSFIYCYWKRKKRPTTQLRPTGVLQCAPMKLLDVATATGNFSDSNVVGQGGFGIVYKGTLPDGQPVAVKRLLKQSARGIQGFLNEVNLIASVQHINLVQLLGYCFEGDENILLFEYLENSSLDTYIFHETRSSDLKWETRLQITIGIARGLSYLHQESRIRIIHMDLKPSNILLDKDMIPKIADFGMAKLFRRDETEASTTKMTGTYGYISPEYAMDGKYSVKSDTFSFGVLLLEIISGRRNRDYFDKNDESLINHIWKKWKEGKGLETIDPNITVTVRSSCEILRFIQIGLLCVQAFAEDRPVMPYVILMLTSDTTQIDQPNSC